MLTVRNSDTFIAGAEIDIIGISDCSVGPCSFVRVLRIVLKLAPPGILEG